MILKISTRVFTTDLESTVATLKAVQGTEPHPRLDDNSLTLVGMGNVLETGGPDEALGRIRGGLGPRIPEDIDDAEGKLLANGASVMLDIKNVPTGRMMDMKHADGGVTERVQWAPEQVERHIFVPLGAWTPA